MFLADNLPTIPPPNSRHADATSLQPDQGAAKTSNTSKQLDLDLTETVLPGDVRRAQRAASETASTQPATQPEIPHEWLSFAILTTLWLPV
jgi:hypothetical protein